MPVPGGTEDSWPLQHTPQLPSLPQALGSNSLYQSFPSWTDGFETEHFGDHWGRVYVEGG